MNKKILKVFFLVSLLILLVGVLSAADVSENTTGVSDTFNEAVQETSYKVDCGVIKEPKEIKKVNEKQDVKTSGKTLDVSDFDTLHNALISNESDTLTLRIKSDITLTGNTAVNKMIKSLTINGNGKTIDGNSQYQFLSIKSASTVRINNLVIRNCYCESGGAIENSGNLTLNKVNLTNNSALWGGAINNDASGNVVITDSNLNYNNATWYGGALYNVKGNVNITRSDFNNNLANEGGAISNQNFYEFVGESNIRGSIILKNSNINCNLAEWGAAISNQNSVVTVIDSNLNCNNATGGGSVINNMDKGTVSITRSNLSYNNATNEGAIYNLNSNVSISSSNITYNFAATGGAISNNYNANITIENSNLNYNAATNGGAVNNNNNANITIKNSNLNYNNATNGGAIYNTGFITVYKTVLNNNRAKDNEGGAIYNKGSVNITNSSLNSNFVKFGGAIYNTATLTVTNSTLNDNTGHDGGAVYNTGTLTLITSSVNNNRALTSGTYKYSGAICNTGTLNIFNSTVNNNKGSDIRAICNNGTLSILNTLFENNSAQDDGGAIYNNGILTVTNSTFNGNKAKNGGAICNVRTLTITNSTLKNNEENRGTVYNTGTLTITGSTINGNYASRDGAIYNTGTVNKIANTILYNNYPSNFIINQNRNIELKNPENYISIGSFSILVDNKEKYSGTGIDELNQYTIPTGNHVIKLLLNGSDAKTANNMFMFINRIVDVHNYNELINAMADSNAYNEYTINLLPGNYNATGNITWSTITTTPYINGNGLTLNGNNKFRFISIAEKQKLILNKINLINYKIEYSGVINNTGTLNISNCKLNSNYAFGGTVYNTGTLSITDTTLNNNRCAIYNEGSLTINNSTLNNNTETAINNKGSLTINNSTLNNNNGGSIYNYGPLTITNSILNNNNAGSGGAIYNHQYDYNNKYSHLAISNSTLNNNTADNNGGAIYNYFGIVTITDTTINNNKAKGYGGAIYNYHCTLTMKNGTLNNNTADNGGAIYNYRYRYDNKYPQSTLTINDTTLNNNTADNGGAIYNYYGLLTVTDSVLNDNNAESDDGGAIYNYGSVIITNSILKGNNAENNGGTVYNYQRNYQLSYNTPPNMTITDSTINKSSAKSGGAIYIDEGTANITNNTFIKNYADDREYDSAIIDMGTDNNIRNNLNCNETYYVNSIFLNGTNSTVKDNTFMGLADTKLSINTLETYYMGKDVIIPVILLDEYDNPMTGRNITVNIDGENYVVKTDEYGEATKYYTPKVIGVKNVSAEFDQADYYESSKANTTFKVKKTNTKISLDISNTTPRVNSTIKITATVNDANGKLLNNTTISVTINGVKSSVKTNNKGVYTQSYKVTTLGTNNVTVAFSGNTLYYSSSNTTSVQVKQATMIKHTYLGNVEFGSTVKVVGRLVSKDTGNAIKYATVTVKVNNKSYKLKTDGAGYVRLNYTVKSYEEQKITFKYAGSSINLASSNSTSFKVKQPTWIKTASMSNVKYGSTVKLVGRLLYNGTNAVKYVPVNVTVNGKTYKVKTDGAGYIRLNYTVNSYNDQKVTFKFAGNSLYLASSNTTIFKVKQPTWIKHASIGTVKKGSTVKFVGRVLYNGTNAVKYVPVNLTVKGKVYNLKTDGAGYFRLNYTTTATGVFTFTSNFGGNNLYLASTNSTKFTVVKS